VLVDSSSFTALTGLAAPSNFATVEARVVKRLSSLLARDLVWSEENTTGYTNTSVPSDLAEAICWGVATLSAPQTSIAPAGVAGYNVAGEYSVQFEQGRIVAADGVAISSSHSHCADLGGRCVTLALRHRRISL